MVEVTRTKSALGAVKALAIGLAFLLGLVVVLVGLYLWSLSEWVIDARRSGIQAEIASLGAGTTWAGTYYRGDGLGCNELISVSPKQGFQYTNHGCLGLYGHDHGTAKQVDSCLRLRSKFLFIPSLEFGEYTIVDWGSRRYLVEPKQMLEFVNAVNQNYRTDVWSGMIQDRSFYLRVGDEEKALEGKPSLPPEYARLLLADRIAGHVTAVDGERVSLDLGLDRGVFEGMELILLGEGDKGYGSALVSEVAEHTSVGRVNYLDSFSPPVAVGWSAASRRGD